MSEKIWLGGIYLKDEGGYEIILKSLNHYKKRLRTIGNSPELKDSAAMFAPLLQQEAMKTVPKIEDTIKKIHNGLYDTKLLTPLGDDLSFLIKAVTCYESDIKKAEDTGHEYFIKLVGDMAQASQDFETIKKALDRIKQYS